MAGLTLPRGGGFWQMGQEHARGALNAYGSQGQKRETEVNQEIINEAIRDKTNMDIDDDLPF